MDNHETMKGQKPTLKQVQAIRCPTCGAGPDKRCANSVREPRKEPHRDRRLIAADSLTLPWRLTGLYR